MSVVERPDGMWRARYRDPAGKERSRHSARKLDATRWLAQVRTRVSVGDWVDPSLVRVTVGEWAALWMASQVQLEPTTEVRHAGIVRNHLLPVWGRVQLAAVMHADVATRVQAMLAEGQSPSSVRAAHGVLGRVLDHAVRDGRPPRNPAASVRLPRPRRAEKRYLGHAEVAVLARESGPCSGLVRTLAHTGLRWSEVAGLRVRGVRLDRRELVIAEAMEDVNGVVAFSETKTHRVRVIPLPRGPRARPRRCRRGQAAGRPGAHLAPRRAAPEREPRRRVLDPAIRAHALRTDAVWVRTRTGLRPRRGGHRKPSPQVGGGAPGRIRTGDTRFRNLFRRPFGRARHQPERTISAAQRPFSR